MLDSLLRPVKDRLLGPLIRGVPSGVSPPGTVDPRLHWQPQSAHRSRPQHLLTLSAVSLWLVSRLADGLDGAVARHQGIASDRGGLVDIVFDTIGYAVIPIGVAVGIDSQTAWIIVAVLLALVLRQCRVVDLSGCTAREAGCRRNRHRGVNEHDHAPRSGRGHRDHRVLHGGTRLVGWSRGVLAAMAGAVGITVAERLWWARKVLA